MMMTLKCGAYSGGKSSVVVNTLYSPGGASGGESLAERGVDEFAERRRTAVDGLGEPQYCCDFTSLEVLARSDFK